MAAHHTNKTRARRAQFIACLLLFTFANMLARLLAKALASHFHKEAHFNKMQAAIRKARAGPAPPRAAQAHARLPCEPPAAPFLRSQARRHDSVSAVRRRGRGGVAALVWGSVAPSPHPVRPLRTVARAEQGPAARAGVLAAGAGHTAPGVAGVAPRRGRRWWPRRAQCALHLQAHRARPRPARGGRNVGGSLCNRWS